MVENQAERMTGLPRSILRAFQLFAVLCTACLLAEIFSRIRHYGFPYIWPLRSYYSAFGDFLFFQSHAATFHTRAFFDTEINYPAPLAVLLDFYYLLPWPLQTFLCSILVGFALAGALFARSLRRRGLSRRGVTFLVLAFAVSFPLWFEFEQGNIEAIVWLIVSLGLWAFLRDRPYTAAVCFCIAGSMKIFPLVFLGLLLARRQYKQLAFACAVGLSVFLTSLWLETGSIALSWHGTAAAAEPFRVGYLLKVDSSGFDHSLFELVKHIAVGRVRHAPPAVVARIGSLLRFYFPTVALAGIAIFFARIRRMPVVNQILALTVASILLPPVSFDYTLIYLYVPCALLILTAIRAARRESDGPMTGLPAALLTMAVLLAPETEFIFRTVSLGGEIKCIALLFLFFIALWYPFKPEATLSYPDHLASSGHLQL